MSSIVTSLFAGGGGVLLDGAAKLVNAIKGKNPEDAAALQALLAKHSDLVTQTDADLAKAKIAENVALNATAGSNIQSEAKGDWFTRNARPAVIWVGLLIMSWSYIVIPMFAIHWQFLKPVDFPSMFWEVWGICVTGYVFARSADKLLGGAGGSLQGPFGLKAESKGDK